MSHKLRSAPEAERKTYLTVKTFTLRIFFSFISSFLSRATFSLPHTSRVIGAYRSPDPTHQKNSKLPREFERCFQLTHGMDRQVHEVALSNTETDWVHIKEPFLSASGADLNSWDILEPVSHMREGCGHNGTHYNLHSLYNLNMWSSESKWNRLCS